jgi:vacuolar-type H+-ATPase subunit I/STV1
VGPALAAVLIHSAIAYRGADGVTHFMSDHSLFVTFWTGAAIMFLAFLLALYFTRAHAVDYSDTSVAKAT